MKIFSLFVFTLFVFILTGCTTLPPHSQSPATPKKNACNIAFYTKQQPKLPYTILGEETISKYNAAGFKRQEAHIRDDLQRIAAAKGGDAIINLKHDQRAFSGTIIAYKIDIVT